MIVGTASAIQRAIAMARWSWCGRVVMARPSGIPSTAICGTSIEAAAECGGVLDIEGGECKTAGPFWGDRATPTVEIYQYEPNCGCPFNSTPVAFWHDHPRLTGAGLPLARDCFEGDDLGIASPYKLHGYIGAVDGRLIWYGWTDRKQHALNGRLPNTTG
jgi:hypothetical protein